MDTLNGDSPGSHFVDQPSILVHEYVTQFIAVNSLRLSLLHVGAGDISFVANAWSSSRDWQLQNSGFNLQGIYTMTQTVWAPEKRKDGVIILPETAGGTLTMSEIIAQLLGETGVRVVTTIGENEGLNSSPIDIARRIVLEHQTKEIPKK